MSILYCTIPHFAASLARRDHPELLREPLILVGPDERVFGTSAEAAECGVVSGLPARIAQIRCPQAKLLDADTARCQSEFEALLELLDLTSSCVEPHELLTGSAYLDLGDMVRDQADGVVFCRETGQKIRQELGAQLQPALGWNSVKFTALAAAKRTRPGHVLAIESSSERAFLRPLSVRLLPLDKDALQRLGFLGLRTLGHYATLPSAAVRQQFGQPGLLSLRCARGEDSRPVIPRSQERCLTGSCALEDPLSDRERLLAVVRRLVSPLLAQLRQQALVCGQVQLIAHFADATTQENSQLLCSPTADEARTLLVLENLFQQMQWQSGAVTLQVTLKRFQDLPGEQLSLFPLEADRQRKLQSVKQYLSARFGANRLLQASLTQPFAPLPEWRVSWLTEEGK